MTNKYLVQSIINKTVTTCFLLMFWQISNVYGQVSSNTNFVFWSPTEKLKIHDFGIKTKNNETSSSMGHFIMDYQVGGFDFMSKNFNKKVRNYLIKSASSIDTTAGITLSLRYQQTLFDISEIYTRQFRRALKENRSKIATGLNFIENLNQKAMTDFANRRVLYDRETEFGNKDDKQKEWEIVIQKELTDLKEFAIQ